MSRSSGKYRIGQIAMLLDEDKTTALYEVIAENKRKYLVKDISKIYIQTYTDSNKYGFLIWLLPIAPFTFFPFIVLIPIDWESALIYTAIICAILHKFINSLGREWTVFELIIITSDGWPTTVVRTKNEESVNKLYNEIQSVREVASQEKHTRETEEESI